MTKSEWSRRQDHPRHAAPYEVKRRPSLRPRRGRRAAHLAPRAAQRVGAHRGGGDLLGGAHHHRGGLALLPGVGRAAPPSWSALLDGGRNYITTGWWLALFPGTVILIVVLVINLIGDWLRDAPLYGCRVIERIAVPTSTVTVPCARMSKAIRTR